MEEFKTIATFNYTHEIMVLKSILDRKEFNIFSKMKRCHSIAPFYSVLLIGGIQTKSSSKRF